MYAEDGRPAGIVVLVVVFVVEGGAWLALAVFLTPLIYFRIGGPGFDALWVGFVVLVLVHVKVALGIWRRAPWSWAAAVVLAMVSLATLPAVLVLEAISQTPPPSGILAGAVAGLWALMGVIALVPLAQRRVRIDLGRYPAHVGERTYEEYVTRLYPGLARARSAPPADAARTAPPPVDPGIPCGACGAPLEAGDGFCGTCGSRVT